MLSLTDLAVIVIEAEGKRKWDWSRLCMNDWYQILELWEQSV